MLTVSPVMGPTVDSAFFLKKDLNLGHWCGNMLECFKFMMHTESTSDAY